MLMRMWNLFFVLTLSIHDYVGGRRQDRISRAVYENDRTYEYEPRQIHPAVVESGTERREIFHGHPHSQESRLQSHIKIDGYSPGVQGDGTSPEFAGPIHNVTVNVGREAVLECHVRNLGEYKVGWLKAGDQTILALHKRVITHNNRVHVSHEDNKIWRLHMKSVLESDRGCYMCQINTQQMKQEIGCLDVNVPPDIDMFNTSKDFTTKENDDAILECYASGHPTPSITWRREDGGDIYITRHAPTGPKVVKAFNGSILHLSRVNRKQMGSYLCIASNEVPPAVSKRIMLSVNFAPEVLVPNQLLGTMIGDNVTLECRVEAYPKTINYWMKVGSDGIESKMLLSNNKHMIYEEKEGLYEVTMKLHIINFEEDDVGMYSCTATNSHGRKDGTIRIYKIDIPLEKRLTVATRGYLAPAPTTTPREQIQIALMDDDNDRRSDRRRGNHRTVSENGNMGENQQHYHQENNNRFDIHYFSSGAKMTVMTSLIICLYFFTANFISCVLI